MSYAAGAMPHVQQAGRPAWRTGGNTIFLKSIAILELVGPGLVNGPSARPSFTSLAGQFVTRRGDDGGLQVQEIATCKTMSEQVSVFGVH